MSPGTLTDAAYLEAREPAYLMAIATAGELYGVGLIDLSPANSRPPNTGTATACRRWRMR